MWGWWRGEFFWVDWADLGDLGGDWAWEDEED